MNKCFKMLGNPNLRRERLVKNVKLKGQLTCELALFALVPHGPPLR